MFNSVLLADKEMVVFTNFFQCIYKYMMCPLWENRIEYTVKLQSCKKTKIIEVCFTKILVLSNN